MTMTAPQTTEIQYLQRKLANWLSSQYRLRQIEGEMYYDGFHPILHREKTTIGENGQKIVDEISPNNRIVDNLYATIVDIKNNYLLSQEICFETDNEQFKKELDKLIDAKFQLKMKNLGQKVLNNGISWIYPYYNEQGDFKFKVFAGQAVLPEWVDEEHDELKWAIRYYEEEKEGSITGEIIKRVEIYTPEGIDNYILVGNILMIDKENPHVDYIMKDGKGYKWSDRIPLIPFRYNNRELPLISRCKSMQDAINLITSNFVNVMDEDIQNTVIILENYDGEDLNQFRRQLARTKAIKVRSEASARGDVRTLRIDVNADNYATVLSLLKSAMVQNCRAYNTEDLKMEGSPNNVQLKSAFLGLDLDANSAISEFKASLDKLFWFIKCHLKETGKGDFTDEQVKVFFNKDSLINESEIITNLTNLGMRVPNELLLEECTFINNPKKAQEMIEAEDRKMLDQLDPYGSVGQGGKGVSSNKKKVNTNQNTSQLMGGNQ